MADQTLQNQFFTTLRASKSFSLLKPEEQNSLLQAFENVSDEQLRAGMMELQKDAMRQQEIEQNSKEGEGRLSRGVKAMEAEMKDIDREERKENEVKESEESSKEAEKLLAGLSKIEDKPKRKKFLGIF